jgi:hypothetical protein
MSEFTFLDDPDAIDAIAKRCRSTTVVAAVEMVESMHSAAREIRRLQARIRELEAIPAHEPCAACETWKQTLEATERDRKRLELRVDELEGAAPPPAANPMGRDADWVLAIGHALGLDSGYRVPIVPSVEEFKRLFTDVRTAQPPEAAEVAWLIEMNAVTPCLYFCDTLGGAFPRFESDHARAIRFARKQDAEAALTILLTLYMRDEDGKPYRVLHDKSCYTVAEHMWCPEPAPTKEVTMSDAPSADAPFQERKAFYSAMRERGYSALEITQAFKRPGKGE